jgi:two-component system NtrC family response regulator
VSQVLLTLAERLAIVERTLLGASEGIRRVRELVVKLAPHDIPVLVQGPTGSGKELVAQALHAASGRDGPFVPRNVCANADTMFDDEMFGHERNAFTGAATSRRGAFELADAGTLFLDEIGRLCLTQQTKLLRAIDTRAFLRVGAERLQTTSCRLVTATNEHISELVDDGRMYPDFAYRITGAVIDVPPLSERPEDVGYLAAHFAARAAAQSGMSVSLDPEVLSALERVEWSGNVRELRNLIESAVVLADSAVIGFGDLLNAAPAPSRLANAGAAIGPATTDLAAVAERFGWNLTRAARHLGVHRDTLRKRLKEFGISRPGTAAGGEPSASVR